MSTTTLCKIHVEMENIVVNYGSIILKQVKTNHIVWIRYGVGGLKHFSGHTLCIVGHLKLLSHYNGWNSYSIDNIKQIEVVR